MSKATPVSAWKAVANDEGEIYILDPEDTTIAIIPAATRGKEDIAHQIAHLPHLTEVVKTAIKDLNDGNSTNGHHVAGYLRMTLEVQEVR